MTHKIALISDIHFGCRNNSEKYLTIMKEFFTDTLSPIIESEKINDLRILGDLFDNRNNINVRTMNTVLYVFRELTKKFPELTIKILIGNHDCYYHNRVDINSLECLREIKNVEIIDKVSEEVINGKILLTVPWMVKDSEIYSDFVRVAKSKLRFDICLGHFEIKDFEVVKGIRDESGLDHDIFKNFVKVFSGHYHIGNTIKNITYLGCPYQLTWNDFGDKKGVTIYDIDNNSVKFIENTLSPQFIKINMRDIVNKNKKIINKISGNFIKLIIEEKYKESFIVKVINKIENMNPLKLDIQNDYVEFDELDVDLSEFKDLSDPLSLLLKYIEDYKEQLDGDIDFIEIKNYMKELYDKVLREND